MPDLRATALIISACISSHTSFISTKIYRIAHNYNYHSHKRNTYHQPHKCLLSISHSLHRQKQQIGRIQKSRRTQNIRPKLIRNQRQKRNRAYVKCYREASEKKNHHFKNNTSLHSDLHSDTIKFTRRLQYRSKTSTKKKTGQISSRPQRYLRTAEYSEDSCSSFDFRSSSH